MSSDIDALEVSGMSVDRFRKHLPAVYEFVMGYTIQWRESNGSGNGIGLDAAALDALAAVAELVDAKNLDTDWTEQTSQALVEQLNVFDALLPQAAGLDEPSRVYLTALTAELRQAILEVGRFGSALVRRLSLQLAGVLVFQAVQLGTTDADIEHGRAFMKSALRIAMIAGKYVFDKSLEIVVDREMKKLGM